MTTKSPKLKPVNCPRCNNEPELVRYRQTRFWVVACTKGPHTLRPVSGHPMKTQAEAIKAWNDEFGPTEAAKP